MLDRIRLCVMPSSSLYFRPDNNRMSFTTRSMKKNRKLRTVKRKWWWRTKKRKIVIEDPCLPAIALTVIRPTYVVETCNVV